MNILNIDPLGLQIIVGVLIGISAGFVGAFMVLRRMSLVGDALSHVALPGIALALLIHINPFVGAFSTLLVAIFGIWLIEKRTSLPSETLVGIFFTIALAVGILLTPQTDLLEALFGDIAKVGGWDVLLTLIAVPITIFLMQRIYKTLVLEIISKDMTRSMGLSVDRANLLFLILVAVIVALGLKVAGTLLMGSLVIIPAAAAKNISLNLKDYTLLSGVFGALCAAAGILIAARFGLPPGPLVVLSSGVLFFLTLLLKERK